MRVGVVGLSHRAPLSVRESVLGFIEVARLKGLPFPHLFLSTCNRVELYFAGEDLAGVHSELIAKLRQASFEGVEQSLYTFFGFECFYHLARVTSGLDSQLLLEGQIQHQVKKCYTVASLEESLPADLHYLFQKALQIGKEMRTRFSLFQLPNSLEHTLYLLCETFALEEKRVLFIGNSEINRQIIAHFARKGGFTLSLATRAPQEAVELVGKYGVSLYPWENLSCWSEAPLIIASTRTSFPLLTCADLEKTALKTRLICDLGVPRNADPALGRHHDLHLLDLEQIGKLLRKKESLPREELQEIEKELFRSVWSKTQSFTRYHERQPLCAGS